jgi:hypothetical protein
MALQSQQEKLAKECTFAPRLKKPQKKVQPPIDNGRTSTGQINLAPIITKNTQSSDTQPFGEERTGPRKCDELYKKHKKQIEKQDKSNQDYEFEKQQEECTFAP